MTGKQIRVALSTLFIVLVSLAQTGCSGGGKNFTAEDFKKVTKDTPEAKVTEILGEPFDSAEAIGVKRKWWKVGNDYYSASFKEGKVEAAEGPSKEEEYKTMKALMQMLKQKG
jgi:hypothetical protein